MGVELVNLRGEIASEKRNASAQAGGRAEGGFGVATLECHLVRPDLDPNVRAIRRQVEQGHVVGLIEANEPDFEFANFSLKELIEIAALMDDRERLNGSLIRQADWQGWIMAAPLLSGTPGLGQAFVSKGKAWGEVLAAYALEHPVDPRTGAERPFCGWSPRRSGRGIQTTSFRKTILRSTRGPSNQSHDLTGSVMIRTAAGDSRCQPA